MYIVRRQIAIVLPQKEIADLRLRIKLCRPPTRPEITPCPLQERVRLPEAEVIPAKQRDDTDAALRVHAGPYPFMRTERHHGIKFLKRAGKLATIDPELMIAGHEQDFGKTRLQRAQCRAEQAQIISDIARQQQHVFPVPLPGQTIDPVEILPVVNVQIRNGEHLHRGCDYT